MCFFNLCGCVCTHLHLWVGSNLWLTVFCCFCVCMCVLAVGGQNSGGGRLVRRARVLHRPNILAVAGAGLNHSNSASLGSAQTTVLLPETHLEAWSDCLAHYSSVALGLTHNCWGIDGSDSTTCTHTDAGGLVLCFWGLFHVKLARVCNLYAL